jgi:hypothetical protein
MPAELLPPAQNRWCDAEGAALSLFSRAEQIAEDPEPEALFSQLHQRGEVVGRSEHLLYVRFDGTAHLVGVAPQLLRLVPDEPGGYQRVAPIVRIFKGNGDDR